MTCNDMCIYIYNSVINTVYIYINITVNNNPHILGLDVTG